MERPRLVPGGKLLDGDYFFFIFCEQPLDKLSQLGFVLGQGGRLVDFVGGQNKGTSGDKEENEDKFSIFPTQRQTQNLKQFFHFFPLGAGVASQKAGQGWGKTRAGHDVHV